MSHVTVHLPTPVSSYELRTDVVKCSYTHLMNLRLRVKRTDFLTYCNSFNILTKLLVY